MAGVARFVRWPSSPASPTQPALQPRSWRGTPAQARCVMCAVRWAGALGQEGGRAHQRDRTALGRVADEVAHQLLHRSARELGPLELLKASELLLGCHLDKLLIQLTARHEGCTLRAMAVGSTVRAQRSVHTPSCPLRSALSAVLASRRPPDPPVDVSPPHPHSGRPHPPPRPCLAPCAST